ncbi:hypothetical protein [Roseivivax sp. THAF197b]|uniref:hypothetical protein n=1 Tax=Roseivivax sp. THAF197b TaxID=2588299 RepID=UPI0012693E86|nr:hypothetical protein [Roseivivax sp. THAF197b]
MTQQIDRAKIELVLSGKLLTTELNEAEQELWLDLFTEKMGKPGPQEEAFFASRRARRLGAGLDPEDDTLRK